MAPVRPNRALCVPLQTKTRPRPLADTTPNGSCLPDKCLALHTIAPAAHDANKASNTKNGRARLPDVVVLCPSADLVAHAAAIALEIGHPVYDCLYLACAEVEGSPLVTADTRLRNAARAYAGVDVWHIAESDVVERTVTAATALVIQETTLLKLIAAYTTFSDTADFVIETVPPLRPSGPRILTPEDQDRYFDTPAYLRLVKLISNLSYEERIDLMALAWFGRQTANFYTWPYLLNHAYQIGAKDPDYEAVLGQYWQAGFDRLRNELSGTT